MASRKSPRNAPVVNTINANVQHPENKWVWILKDDINTPTSDSEDSEVIPLRHPNSDMRTLFLFSHIDNTVQEILTCNDKKPRSWFIGDFVKSDGGFKLSTPVDPIFLVLPYLRKCSPQAVPLDQLLCDEDFPKTELLLKCNAMKTLGLVADKKGFDDMEAYKYNEEKTLKWLQRKVEKVSVILQKKRIGGITDGVASSIFIDSSRTTDDDTLTNTNYLKYAHGIVSDYIQPDLSQKLFSHLNLVKETPTVNLKRKSTSHDVEPKKAKIEKDDSPISKPDLKKPATKPAKQSSKEKFRAKAASGSKTLSAFFKKI